MHYLLKQLVPPIAHTLRWYSLQYGWKGAYSSFTEAQQKSTGYDATQILERIIQTTKKVRDKEIPYERDGIEYDTPKMNFPLLSTLLWIAAQHNGELTLIDMGGSLGTTYFQNIPFLKSIQKLNWCIIEQANYVAIGKKEFETDQLKFYYSIEECLQNHKPQIILFCNAIQYFENPYAFLTTIPKTIPYLLLDYVGYTATTEDRITIQHVPPVFYGVDVSYPCWFFSKSKMFAELGKNYDKVFEFTSEPDKYYIGFQPFLYEGQLWKLK
jgi:putative methyltransferase (TIGR04325 family)